jgi:1-deoxy-D-xylulose-5-phosphate synthase
MVTMFDTIPLTQPHTPLLDQVSDPARLRDLSEDQLPELARELREFLLYSVGQTGGHFGAGLGVVELTVALHYVLNTPEDRIVWDVGHQTYPHKILTERRNAMASIRQFNGISGFPKRSESEYDTFGVGHSSTSISAALGMAVASQLRDSNQHNVAVIGDGAMTAGMAFEALNHAAHVDNDMLVILNDNNMSISKNVGGLATYFSKVWASKTYSALRKGSKRVLEKIPQAWELARKTEEHMKGMVSPGTLFEELGFYYVGPIHGHDIPSLIHYLRNMLAIKGPKLLHIITQKGYGFSPAVDDPVGYHALNKIEPKRKVREVNAAAPKKLKYQDVFGQWICRSAENDSTLIGITPAMCEGSGLVEFCKRFPDQYHDVAIAEQHAVTFAAGLACEGFKPVVAIYSTFLQRAYDQLVHDVALQNLDVTFAIDRAGLVGEDGPTHAGSFDISYLRCIPNMIIAAPSDENECAQLLNSAYAYKGPAAVRYPRGTGPGAAIKPSDEGFTIGKGRQLRKGKGGCILNFGVLLDTALEMAEKYDYSLCDMRWVKPLDKELLSAMAMEHDFFISIEENAVAGGAGAGCMEYLQSEGLTLPFLTLGLPDINFEHGKRSELLDQAGLSANKVDQSIQSWLGKLANFAQRQAQASKKI